MRRIGAWFLVWCAGCFSPADKGSESANASTEAAAADQLLYALELDNGVWVDSPLPQPSGVSLALNVHPQQLKLEPGDTGTLELRVTGVGDTNRLSTLRMSRARGERYVEVPRVSDSTDRPDVLEAKFSVSEDVCSRLCNRRYESDLLVSVALAGGEQSSRAILRAELDCRATGRVELCDTGLGASLVRYTNAIEAYQQVLCDCSIESCDEKQDLPVTFQCMLDTLAAHPSSTGPLADCMAEELETLAECMADEVCNPQLCGNPNTIFELPRNCGLERGLVNDELTSCVLERRSETEFVCSSGLVPSEWLCDFSFECLSGMDELACPLPFECPLDGSEVGVAWTCNGSFDCLGGADEESCPGGILTPF